MSTGEEEILVTSIKDPTITHSVLDDLYHKRWNIEEYYKKIKARMKVENFSGKSALSVQQDFHAHVLLGNLCSLLVYSTDKAVEEKTKQRKRPYKTNWTEALRILKEELVRVFLRPTKYLFSEIVEEIAEYFEPVRHGRSYPRLFSKKSNRSNFGYQ